MNKKLFLISLLVALLSVGSNLNAQTKIFNLKDIQSYEYQESAPIHGIGDRTLRIYFIDDKGLCDTLVIRDCSQVVVSNSVINISDCGDQHLDIIILNLNNKKLNSCGQLDDCLFLKKILNLITKTECNFDSIKLQICE